jgi:hypothetical protein
MAQAALVAVAIAALAAVALMAAVVPRGASAESLLEQAKVDAALNQVPACVCVRAVRAVVQAGGEGATRSAGAYRGCPGRVIG